MPEASGFRLQRNWTMSDGLPADGVTSIVQTRDGFLWFGTFGGLVRFDGIDLEVYRLASVPELASDQVVSLCESRDGSLWIGTDGDGVSRYRNGSFTHFGAEQGAPGGSLSSIAEAPDGSVWFAGTGISRWIDGRLEIVEFPDGVQIEYASALAVHPDGEVWAATSAGLFRFEDGRFRRVPWEDGRAYESAWMVAWESRGGLWAATSAGFGRIGERGLESLELRGEADFSTWPISRTQDSEGSTLLATTAGLRSVQIDEQGIRFTPYLSGEMERRPARAALLDREGSLWAALAFKGVSQFILREFVEIARPGDVGTRIRVADDGERGLWCAVEGQLGIWHLTDQGNFSPPWSGELEPGRQVWSLLTSADGRLWIHQKRGLTAIQGEHVERHEHPSMRDLHRAWGSPLLEDEAGGIWCCGRGSLLRLEGGEFAEYIPDDELLRAYPTDLMQSRDGSIWVVVGDGVGRLSEGEFTLWTRDDGIPRGTVRTICEASDGGIWIGTYGGGLARLVGQRFVTINSTHGLYDDSVSRIMDDGLGFLWVNSNRGVYRVDLAELSAAAMGDEVVLVCRPLGSAEAAGNGGCRMRDGRLVFETVDGLVIVRPESIRPTSAPPKVVVLSAKCDNRPIPLSEPVEVAPGRRDLSFRFTAPNFRNPESIVFQYRIEGLDEEWQGGDSQRQIRYARVPPGAYRFEVRARSGEGLWSPEASGIDFVLRPYFYETRWFFTISLLAAVALVAGGVGWYTWEVRRRNRRLRREVARRTQAEGTLRALASRLIGAQETERKRVARELHDDVSQRLALLSIDLDVLAELATEEEAEGSTPEKLEELAKQTKVLAKDIHGISYRLHPSKLSQLGLLPALRSLSRETSERYGVAVEFSDSGAPAPIPEEVTLCMFRIAQEALRNSAKHSGAETARVEIRFRKDAVRLVISDPGCGFRPDSVGHGGGLGLVSMSERVRLVGGVIEVHSHPGVGTRIEVEIPLRNTST